MTAVKTSPLVKTCSLFSLPCAVSIHPIYLSSTYVEPTVHWNCCRNISKKISVSTRIMISYIYDYPCQLRGNSDGYGVWCSLFYCKFKKLIISKSSQIVTLRQSPYYKIHDHLCWKPRTFNSLPSALWETCKWRVANIFGYIPNEMHCYCCSRDQTWRL